MPWRPRRRRRSKTRCSEVNASLQSRSVGLQFEMDKDTDKVIVKVVDRASGEVIRQIPTEEVVRIAKVLGKAPGHAGEPVTA